ncbi:MAG TPA: RNase adapter RapZ [Terriglobales bacterium]|nr:RNase adapter RapZ [Terriglobales bacterium]
MANTLKDNRFLVITGLSGSGKTVVSRFLEDRGYYCVDNLPAKLIPDFVELWLKKKVEIDRVALVLDIREPHFLTEFPRVLKEIRKRVPARLVFLDASDEALVKRFSETRRPHPLSRRGSILEGVRLERRRLAAVKKAADEVIETSGLNLSQLKEVISRRVLRARSLRMQTVLISFGYKYGIPLDSDLVFDTRFLPNPFYIDRLRDRNGKARSVREFVLSSPETAGFLRELVRFTDFMIPRFVKEGKSTLTIAIGCTGGKHRSVVIAEELRSRLRKTGGEIRIYHRDLYK